MPDEPTSDEPFTTVRAVREAASEALQALQFVGPATAETLVQAAISADDIRDQKVTYLQLVKLGVDPGVAGHLRREHSLLWSDEPAEGARLRRRAQHVRHLRDGERDWIDQTSAYLPSKRAPTPTAAPDGNGDAIEAERAWRARSRRRSSDALDRSADRTEPPMSGPPSIDTTSTATQLASGVDPSEYTVSELEEVLELIDDPELLALIRQAEREGEDRATALDAIERRMRAVGVDPAKVSVPVTSGPPPHPVPGVSRVTDTRERARQAFDALTSDSLTASFHRVRDRLIFAVESIGSASDTVATSSSSSMHRLRTMDREKARQLSIALLLGLTCFSFAEVFITALQPVYGPPMAALPLFLITAIAGIVSLPLSFWETDGGDELALVTGVLGLLSVGLVALGFVGAVTFGTAIITLPAYALVALALLATTQPNRHLSGFN